MAEVPPSTTVAEIRAMTDAMIEAIALVMVAFSGMRVLYGSWPWEGRKTWYRTKRFVPAMPPPEQTNSEAKEAPTKSFVPVMAPLEQINTEAKETPADTDSDHFDRELMAAE